MKRTLENSQKCPDSRTSLWDTTPIGDVLNLNLSYYRNPRLLLREKALRLAHKHAQQSSETNLCCFFLGTIAVDSDEKGVTLILDRFDPGREQPGKSGKVPTALLPQDVLVPFEYVTWDGTSSVSVLHSAEDLHYASKMLKQNCSSREPLDLSKLLSVQAHLRCSQLDDLDFVMQWTALTFGNALNMVPIKPIPIIPTALARSLRFPENMAGKTHRGNQKQGFLTMDETHKLLLILESDSKAYTLPVVGVWLSGLNHIANPVVWAWCLRFLLNSTLQDRVMLDGSCFLVVLFSLTHRDPAVYQCKPVGRQLDVVYKLFDSSKSFTLYKNVDVSEGKVLKFELSEERQNIGTEVFRELLSQASLRSGFSVTDQDSGVEDEDLSPRPSPNPHPLSQQTKRVHPLVPELSLVMDSTFKETERIGSDDLYAPHSTFPDLQQRGTAPSLQINSGIRVSGRMPPLVRPTHSLIVPQIEGQANAKMQQLVCSGKKRSLFAKNALEQSSMSLSRTKDPKYLVGDSLNDSTNDVCYGASRVVFPMFSPHVHSQDCSPGHDAPPAPMISHKRHIDYPKHFQTTANNMNQPCIGSFSHPHNYTPVCPTSSSDPIAIFPPILTYSNTSGPLQSHPTICQLVNYSVSSDLAASKPDAPDLTAQLQYNPKNAAHIREHIENPSYINLGYQAQATTRSVAIRPFENQDESAGIFPSNAYQILIEQDRQLKSLQSQVLELLETQGKEGRSAPSIGQTAILNLPEQPSVKSVSIAVATGASLLCNNPVHADTGKCSKEDLPTESELGIQDYYKARSRSTYDCTYLTKRQQEGPEDIESREAKQVSYANQSRSKGLHEIIYQSPVLGESASMYYHSPSAKQDNLPSPQTRIQESRFYEGLLGQINSCLQGNKEVQKEDDGMKIRKSYFPSENLSLSPEVTQPSPDCVTLLCTNNAESIGLPETKHVRCGTLIQLQRLGVHVAVESGPPSKARQSSVTSSSTLASINPAVVLSRMRCPESVGASPWFPGAKVDLSLEANAIALKYLTDSQLSRLSLGSQQPLDHKRNLNSDLSALLSAKPLSEKSTIDTSFLSPNMSLATRKYMKRYGLIEDCSDEEDEQCCEDIFSDQEGGQWEVSERPDPKFGLVPKTITSESPHLAPLFPQTKHLDTQSQLFNDLRPKMQLLACMTKQSSDRESSAKLQQSTVERHRSCPAPEGSVGNFLDLTRLRQLPKLF